MTSTWDQASGAERASTQRVYAATAGDLRRCVRDLAADLLRAGVGPTARTRIATACCEVVDNAVRHAYPREPGPIWARLCVTPPTGSPTAGPLVSIEIRDRGRGFDAPRALARAHAPAGHAAGGLARAAALCEYLRISSNSAGTAVRLDFELAPSTFEEDGIDQLYERDWLDPIAAKRALAAAMLGASPDEFGLSPAMAVTIGRLLAGPTGAQALRTALWSDSRGEAA